MNTDNGLNLESDIFAFENIKYKLIDFKKIKKFINLILFTKKGKTIFKYIVYTISIFLIYNSIRLNIEILNLKKALILKKELILAIKEIEEITPGVGGRLFEINGRIVKGEVLGLNCDIAELPKTKSDLSYIEEIKIHGIQLYKPREKGFSNPVIDGYVSSPYGDGWVTYYNKKLNEKVTRWRSNHKGNDIVMRKDGSIYGGADGIVCDILKNHRYFGNSVVIYHEIDNDGIIEKYYTFYAHLENVYVVKGDIIKKILNEDGLINEELSTTLGNVGNTGNSFGIHLHLEIWKKINNEWKVINYYRNSTRGRVYNRRYNASTYIWK